MDSHLNSRISAVILLLFLLIIGTHAASAQRLSGNTAPAANSNNPNLMVTPRMVTQGGTTTVAYTLAPGYGNKVDIEVVNNTGTIEFAQTLAFPTGRFSYPLSTANFSPGEYTVNVKNGNLIHRRTFRVLR